MKVLILTEDRYAAILKALDASDARDLIGTANAVSELPEARELHALARNGGEPEAFTQARERFEAVGFASDRIREQLHELILAAHAVGVPSGKLTAWSGYHPRRIHQIINPNPTPKG